MKKKSPSQRLNLCLLSCSSLPPPRPSESLTLGPFIDLPDGDLAQCVGEAGAEGMSYCSLSSAARWTHGGPAYINQFCRSSHMSKQHDNPSGCYLPPPRRTVNKGSRRCRRGSCRCERAHVQFFCMHRWCTDICWSSGIDFFLKKSKSSQVVCMCCGMRYVF